MNRGNRRHPTAGLLAIAAGAAMLALGGCAPDSGYDTASDYDVVVTRYAPNAEFQSYTTFAVADTILHLGNPDGEDDDITRTFDALIIEELEDQMLRMGYTLEPDPDGNRPDLVLIAGITTSTWTGYVPSYPYYPGYPWYGGGWYPYYPYYGYGYTYEYDTGTIFVGMADVATLDEVTGEVAFVWTAGINGIAGSSASSNSQRIVTNIRQAFDQSPYLKKSQ